MFCRLVKDHFANSRPIAHNALAIYLHTMKTVQPWRRIGYLCMVIFLTWLALATRSHSHWFHPLVVTYGGDIIWAGMFLFFLRIFFLRTALWKLALVAYALGVADECTQLYHAAWADNIRATTIGRLLFGAGFLWSDIASYAIGIVLAFVIIWLLEGRKLLAVTSPLLHPLHQTNK